MRSYYRFAALIAAIILLGACNQRQPTLKSSFRTIVDKEVWRVCDSLTESNAYAEDSAGARRLLQQQLERFPDWKDSATHSWLLLQSSEIYGYHGPLDSVERLCEQALNYFENHPEYPLPLNMC